MKNWRLLSLAMFFMALSFNSKAQMCTTAPETLIISISGCEAANGSYELTLVDCYQRFGFIGYTYTQTLPNGDVVSLGAFNDYPVYYNQMWLKYYDASSGSYAIDDLSNRFCTSQTIVWPANFVEEFNPCNRRGSCSTVTYSESSDSDGDGVFDADDACADTPTGEVANSDGCSCSQLTVDDGDECTLDACINGIVTNTFQDADGDGVCDVNDICPGGDDNLDSDVDGTPDFCDACPFDADNDADGDGVCGDVDNCIETANPDQADGDGDGIGDACDACPTIGDPNCATCGNNKYLVCHAPAGNPENLQQLCLPYNSALAHIGNHGGCFWGHCEPGARLGTSGNEDLLVDEHAQMDNNPLIETESGSVYYYELAPNPATNSVNIHLHGQSENAQLLIRDQLGRILHNQQLDPQHSNFSISLDDAQYINGLYFVTILTDGETITRQLMIKK